MTLSELNSRRSQWGEGPVWWQDHLWYVDIEGHALIRFHPQSQDETLWNVGQRIGFALPCDDGRWIWGGDTGLFFLDTENGTSTPVTDPETTLPDNRFNDAGTSPDGRLFAGTISMKKVTGSASLYRLDPDLSCHRVYPNVTNSNGIGWSPDGKTCYYIDTPSYNIRSFDYDAASGDLSNERIIFNTESKVKGVPDGLCVDAGDHLWIAFCHGGCVVKFDSAGNELDRIEFPCSESTSCCFGGPDLLDLYVTTGINSKIPEEAAGKLFVVKNAGKGIPQPLFRILP